MAKNKVEINGIDTNNLSVLSSSEMNDLFLRLEKGDKNSKTKLIEGNLKLVLSIIKKYQNKCDNLDDLFQIGVIGLIKAIDNFDLSFGVRFSTYAVLMIDGEIKRYIRDNSQMRISRGIKELSYKIINYREKYLLDNYRYPSDKEVCEEFNINEYELSNILNSLNEPISIFDPIYSDNGDTIYLIDQLEDKTKKDLDLLLSLKEALSKLSEREREILNRRYIYGLSQAEIASGLNISQAQVSRIENSALNSVKKLIL
ncbi:MAG: sigma-70 family RNA polymerase sigma factor [Bacilli bacterium]|nr:sigma-70 family RNA polymerase sigma factor [Bacilli bacterium]